MYYLLSVQGNEHVRHSFTFVFIFKLLKVEQTIASCFVSYCLFNKQLPRCRASVQVIDHRLHANVARLNESVANEAIAECVTDVLTTF